MTSTDPNPPHPRWSLPHSLSSFCAFLCWLWLFRPSPASAGDNPDKVPGFRLKLEAPTADGKTALDVRHARLVALYVPAGEAVSPSPAYHSADSQPLTSRSFAPWATIRSWTGEQWAPRAVFSSMPGACDP